MIYFNVRYVANKALDFTLSSLCCRPMMTNYRVAATVLIIIVAYLLGERPGTKYSTWQLTLDLENAQQNFVIWDKTKQDLLISGQLGMGLNLLGSRYQCSGQRSDSICIEWPGLAKLIIERKKYDADDECYDIVWQSLSAKVAPKDCFDTKDTHWYGGPEIFAQQWPIEGAPMNLQQYVSGDYVDKPHVFGSVLENYWLSSRGAGIHVAESVPLHYGINSEKLCLKADYRASIFPRSSQNVLPRLNYSICRAGNNLRDTHHFMSSGLFSKPKDIPDELMFRSPIWSTWARYKINIDQSVILKFANEIKDHGFSNSQIEIDDIYTINYGDFIFDTVRFSQARQMLRELHAMGFRVTSWVHPFSNLDSSAFQEGLKQGYFVKDPGGKMPGLVQWWQGTGAIVDSTNHKAVTWWTERLKAMQSLGIDSFKFDAGEACYLPASFHTIFPLMNPGQFTTAYVNMVAHFGRQIEVRAGFQSQQHPIFVRMLDKHSTWDYNNGLKTMIPTALQFSLLGYHFILPDMIGGNAYDFNATAETVGNTALLHTETLPERELYIRWLQLSAFFPSMQFSIVPWQYDDGVVEIAKAFVKLHEDYITPIILRLARQATQTGDPILRPLWWVAPNDAITHTIDNQFLIGDSILVAPVLEKGATARDIYLPEGNWVDKLRGERYRGGQWLHNVQADIKECPYFEKSPDP
ncbi:myogenesis-regulating glycosidase isoform X1 [Lingula anatina]|uniref:Myogenesis-regulating glycosidase isoform X1 n=2 Tax=Lingula anatina TaxID=7574 RepID=A0A1S3HND1_LINAN|nr:myogenesis-regulating glycosidase isoform X1 [Lingula anatina]|eukprot:XP_013387026.1 myogenesis-regulating glycosidase isoform X1 [Lingula anatina]